MAENAVLSVELDRDIEERFSKIAQNMNRSPSLLAAAAIEDSVRLQEQQIAGIHDAIASADKGDLVAHDDVREWIDSLGTANERALPYGE